MSLSTRTFTFTDGTIAYGSQVETEIGALSTLFNNLDSASTAWSNVKAATINATTLLLGKGTVTNDNAIAGNIGEVISSTVGNTAVPANNVYGDITNIVLTAGDWDVTGFAIFDAGTPATWTQTLLGISTTAGNSSVGLTLGDTQTQESHASSSTTPLVVPLIVPFVRMSLASTTTVYLKMRVLYSLNTPVVDGGRIYARRMR